MGIEITGLRKSFGAGPPAVADMDVTVPAGEMLVLLGPSGCGKTTTMRCIAGLEAPEAGRIVIAGQTVFDAGKGINVPVNRRHVGMVFQSYAIWPHMTVFENVAFSLEMEGVGRDEMRERVEIMLKTVGLEGFSERGASYLSGGQMQRVALARSLVMRPSVLLFDEPLSNLDARLRDHLRVQLRELQTEFKITSVYVTHDQREALALADCIAVMNLGKVIQADQPVVLYNNPRTSTIAEFLGYTNIFAVEIVERGAQPLVALAASGRRLRAVPSSASTGDAPLALCVRPEEVDLERLGDAGAGTLPENAVIGEIILASFMGSHMHYRVRVGEHEVWEALSATISSDLKRGARVVVRIDPRHARLLIKE